MPYRPSREPTDVFQTGLHRLFHGLRLIRCGSGASEQLEKVLEGWLLLLVEGGNSFVVFAQRILLEDRMIADEQVPVVASGRPKY